MNINSIDSGNISVQSSRDEQHAHTTNQQVENMTQAETASEEVLGVAQKKIPAPMIPTPLYIFFFLSQL